MKNTVIEKRMISMKNLKTLSERKKTFLWPKKTADKGKKEKKKKKYTSTKKKVWKRTSWKKEFWEELNELQRNIWKREKET